MTTAAETNPASEAPAQVSRLAVLLSLEGVAGSERHATFHVLVSILGDRGAKLSPAHVSRFCLSSSPESYLDDLLAAIHVPRQAADNLAEDVRGGIAMRLSSKSASLPKGLREILEAARNETGARLAALSGLTQATTAALMESLGLGDLGVELSVLHRDEEDVFPRADSWLKLAKNVGRSPQECVVIAGSQIEAKSALSAGMRCIAVPDTFTAFQDFGGANLVVDDLDDVSMDEVRTLFRTEPE